MKIVKIKLLILFFLLCVIANGQINLTVSSTSVVCYGQCDGTATANVSGGTTPYTYFWSTTETTQIITGLCANNYTVTVTDVFGATATGTVSITQPAPLSLTIAAIANASCSGCAPWNGTAPYPGGHGCTDGSQCISGVCDRGICK